MTVHAWPADAQQWLIDANQRIDQYRKGDLKVSIVGSAGQVVEGAQVEVDMQRHAFGFGTAVTARWVNENSADGDIYRAKLQENFNTVVFENDLKWPPWEGLWGANYNWTNTEQALDWLDANNLPARGHYLSWATWNGPNAWGTSSDESTLPGRLFDHITDEASTVGDRVTEWDVINHPVGWLGDTYENRFGIDFFKDIVDHARSVAPAGMPMWINEDDITSGGNTDDYERIIQYLIDEGSSPDGIGIQGHINQDWGRIRTPDEVYAQLDRMADLIPRLKITELDVHTPGDDLYQAEVLHDYLVTFFSHPAMEEVLLWGFWGGAHWLGDEGALYRSDWTEKPILTTYQDLVFNQWWTEEGGETDASGEFDVRGFLGEYEVTVNYAGQEIIAPYSLESGSHVIEVVLADLHTWDASAASELWGTAGNWLGAGVPAAGWTADLRNSQAFDQTAVVSADSTVDRIHVSGQGSAMTLHVQSGVNLAAASVIVDSLGVARVDGSLTTTTFDVNAGGGVRVEASNPGLTQIAADADVTIAAGATLTIDAGTPATGAHLFSIIQADADSAGGELVHGTFDAVNLPADDGLGRRYSVLYENRSSSGVGPVDAVKVGLARPGDADFDGTVDALDLFAASPLFGTTSPANWREGNWNDTGGSQGLVDAIDLLDASPFFNLSYGSGDVVLGGDDHGQPNDGQPSICYDYTTGEILIDTDGNTIDSYVLTSAAQIFTGAAPNFIDPGGLFIQDEDFRISENFFAPPLNGVHSLSFVAQTGLSQAFLIDDLELLGGWTGNSNFQFDLIVKNTPEPSTLLLVVLGLLGLVGVARRRACRR